MTDRMVPQPLTEADVRRIVDEQICAFLRRLDDRSRWLLQHQPSMVPAEEERRLRDAFGESDPRRFTLDDLERFITATGDATVVEYLAAKYLQSDEARRAGAVVAAEGLLRELAALLPTLRPE